MQAVAPAPLEVGYGNKLGCNSDMGATGVQLFPQQLWSTSRTFSVWSIFLVLLQRGTGAANTGGGSGVVQGQPSSWGGDGQEGLSPVCDSQVPSPHSGHSCSTPEHLLQLWGQCPAVTAAALSGLWALMGTHTQTPQCLTIAGPRMADKG